MFHFVHGINTTKDGKLYMNFMEQMRLKNSPEYQEKKKKEFRQNMIKSLASDTCDEMKRIIGGKWKDHAVRGYLTLYVLDGNNISIADKLDKGDKKSGGITTGGLRYTYPGYLKLDSYEEVDLFINLVKQGFSADGIDDASIRAEKIVVESYDPSTLLKRKTKVKDAYVFYVDIKW